MDPASHLGSALALAVKVNDKAAAVLLPLEREIMGWASEYRAIMWEAVEIRAQELKAAAGG